MNKITKANFKKLVSVLTLTLVMTLGMSISVFQLKVPLMDTLLLAHLI